MKILSLVFVALVAAGFSTPPQLDLVRIDISHPDQVKELDRAGIIINSVAPDHVVAEIERSEYLSLAARGFHAKLLQENISGVYYANSLTKSPFGRYLTYTEFRDSMITIAGNNPGICRLETLGTTAQARLILSMKISDNAAVNEQEPPVHFDGDTHGDEKCGWAACWEMIKYLVSRYTTDTLVARLVNTREIYIAPMFNPDGFNSGSRYNSRTVDLNRNWGWMWGNESACGADFMSENETRAFMAHFWRHPFATFISYHGGTLMISEPWSYTDRMVLPESVLIHHLSRGYRSYTNYPYGQGSIVMYLINGSSKDYNYGCGGEMGWSVEVCMTKTPPADSIDRIFARDGPAMRYIMNKAGFGIHGRVTDSVTGAPLYAHIMVGPTNVISHSCPTNGDYHRFYLPGTYSLTVRAPGYDPKTISNVVVPNNTRDSSVTVNVGLRRNTTARVYATRVIGSQWVTTTSNLTYPYRAVGPQDGQAYQLDATKWIVLAMDVPIKNVSGNDFTVYRSSGTGTATVRIGNSWSGSWSIAGTANAAATSFDIASTGLDSARYVRLEAASQFMLDAIEASQRVGVAEEPRVVPPVIDDFRIWPNVMRSGSKVNFANPLAKPAEVTIYNAAGRKVCALTIPVRVSSVPFADLAAGVYFVGLEGAAARARITVVQ